MKQNIDVFNQHRTRRRRRFSVVLLICLVLFGYFSIHYFNTQSSIISVEAQKLTELAMSRGEHILAVKKLDELRVSERAARDGYSRDMFGKVWAEYYGCDVRNIILQRDLQEAIIDDNRCTVLEGTLEDDPFTGANIRFKKGDSGKSIHIEHIVSLSDAWQKGAQNMVVEDRQTFANDPLNLVAVDGEANMTKGDSDASEWLPRQEYQCMYVARQIAVKNKYRIWVTRAEHRAMRKVLESCPGQLLPIDLSGLNKDDW
jgi:hypothetical protein